MSVENAPLNQRSLHGAKKIRADHCVVDDGLLNERHGRAPDHVDSSSREEEIPSAERHVGKQRHGACRRNFAQTVEHFSVEARVVAIKRANRIHAKRKQVIRIES